MSYLEELLPEFRKGAKIRRSIWDNKEIFVEINEAGEPVLNNGNKFEFCKNITCSDWELYQEPIGWEYIIKNKCLCWFGVIGKEKQRIGTVEHIAEFRKCCTYYINHDEGFSFCRPVRRDEVTFYEDKKDVL